MKKKLIFIVCSVILLAAAFAIRFGRYYPAACDEFAENGLKGSLSNAVNENLLKKTAKEPNGGNRIAKVIFKDDGTAAAIEIDAAKLNESAYGIAKTVFDSVAEAENEYGIPLGNALGSRIFSGRGPEIPVKIIPLNSVSYDIESKLISGGINQTLHRISVRYTLTVKCLAPFEERFFTVDGEAVITETLIIGEVPEILFPGSSGR